MRPGVWIGSLGALSMAIAVALGAFGAHGLKSHFAKAADREVAAAALDRWDTAVKYQMVQSGLVVAMALVAGQAGRWTGGLQLAATLAGIGAVTFCGGLYTYVLTDAKAIVAVLPVGGGLMIVSWIVFAVSWLRLDKTPTER